MILEVSSQKEGGCGFKMRLRRILNPQSPPFIEMILLEQETTDTHRSTQIESKKFTGILV
jgi:hypothetical protein